MKKSAKDYLCYALDQIESLDELERRVRHLSPYIGFFKIGLESFVAYGDKGIDVVKEAGAKLFLDLKFFDIPQTVEKAVKRADQLEVDIIDVHALGGREMLARARSAAKRSKLIGVTLLTSFATNQWQESQKSTLSDEEIIDELFVDCIDEQLDGIVSSAWELPMLKDRAPRNFLFITPGISHLTTYGDQKRVSSASEAIRWGSGLLVVGRGIGIEEDHMVENARKYLAEVESCIQ